MDTLYKVVHWDHPGFGSCIQRSKEPLVVGENPIPIRVGTVLRCEKALGIVLPYRKTQDGTDIHGHSVAVQLLYSVLREKYKMSKDMKYEVWSLNCSEILKGETATAAKSEPKIYLTTLLEAEAEVEEEERKARALLEPPKREKKKEEEKVDPPEEKPIGRTAVKRTPIVVTKTPAVTKTSVSAVIVRTPVKRTPITDLSIEAMRKKLG